MSSTIAYASTGIPKTRSHAHGSLRTRTRSSSQSASCAAASRPVYPVYPVYRCSQIQPTGLTGHWSLFATGPEGSLFHPRMVRTEGRGPGLPCLKQNLFHPRMIRPVVGGGGPTCLKQNLFHSRMIRPVVGGGGPTYLKQMRVIHKGQKELSTKGHEVGWICCIGTSRGRQPGVCPPPLQPSPSGSAFATLP